MERKNWTEFQDQVLKHLKEDRKIKRWTDIAKIMQTQYKVFGRNGKQCRERYHTHLERVFPKRAWTRNQELELLALHSEIGNKWSKIAQKMSDRSDNNIKNHFYSKLRRGSRKVNKFIQRLFYKQKRQIKFNDVYLFMQIFESKFRGACQWQDHQSDIAKDLKNRLFMLALDQDQAAEQQTQENLSLARDIVIFLESIKKISKKGRKPRGAIKHQQTPFISMRYGYALIDIQSKPSCVKTSVSIQEKPQQKQIKTDLLQAQEDDCQISIWNLQPQCQQHPCSVESLLQSLAWQYNGSLEEWCESSQLEKMIPYSREEERYDLNVFKF